MAAQTHGGNWNKAGFPSTIIASLCLGTVTALGHTHLGLLLHLCQCLREFHGVEQAGLVMQ